MGSWWRRDVCELRLLFYAALLCSIDECPHTLWHNRDNVTVVVVDLSQQEDTGVLEAVQAPLASGAIVEAPEVDGLTSPMEG